LLLATKSAATLAVSFYVVHAVEYMNLTSEAPLEVPATRPPAAWPANGSVEFAAVRMRYRPGLPLVLKGVSFKVEGREKVRCADT
jgi:ABC-type multidrug transport system fused ATPase/permease subunit